MLIESTELFDGAHAAREIGITPSAFSVYAKNHEVPTVEAENVHGKLYQREVIEAIRDARIAKVQARVEALEAGDDRATRLEKAKAQLAALEAAVK